MSKEKLRWAKFYWSDWRGEICLKACSYAARGLWMDMLCIAADADPVGYVLVSGETPSAAELARLTGGKEEDVSQLILELKRHGVFSVDGKGRMYSRRMVSQQKKAKTAQKNGKKGGNPNLRKKKENSVSDNQNDNPQDNAGLNTQRLEARDQSISSNEDITEEGGKNSDENPAPKTPPDQPSPADLELIYEGHVIRLTRKDWNAWKVEYGLSEKQMIDLCNDRDDFLKRLPDSDNRRKRWWMPTRKWFDNEASAIRMQQQGDQS